VPTIDVQGTPVHYQRTGTGRAVVLLHGGGLDDAGLSWSPLSPLLVGRALMIAPDLPGFGDSPLGATPPTVTGYAGWLAAFLDAVGLPRCVLGGLSLGGAVAIRTALEAPHRVTGVLGCAPYGNRPTRTRRTPRLARRSQPRRCRSGLVGHEA